MVCCDWAGGYTANTKNVCRKCLDREFRLLYGSCLNGLCKGKRDCVQHKHLWDRPEGWPESYPPPENADAAYHRGSDADVAMRMADMRMAEKAKAQKPEQEDTKRWQGYSDRLDVLMGKPLRASGLRETNIEREARVDAAVAAMARRIEARRIEEWGDADCAVGEPISRFMGITPL